MLKSSHHTLRDLRKKHWDGFEIMRPRIGQLGQMGYKSDWWLGRALSQLLETLTIETTNKSQPQYYPLLFSYLLPASCPYYCCVPCPHIPRVLETSIPPMWRIGRSSYKCKGGLEDGTYCLENNWWTSRLRDPVFFPHHRGQNSGSGWALILTFIAQLTLAFLAHCRPRWDLR